MAAEYPRKLIVFAALSAALAVIAGALGAHVAPTDLHTQWFRTGAEYQMIHAVGALAAGPIAPRAGWTLLAGAMIFSGTLYIMAMGGPRWLGAVTPIGGVTMIAGWLLLAVIVLRQTDSAPS